MTHRIGIGIVGAGFLAETRARCYARVHGPRVELAAVASRDPERARAFAARHGAARACASVEELLALGEVDAVDLCVPNALHRPLAEAAAAAGKHVVCTKPLAVAVDVADARARLERATAEARAMVAACERAGVRLAYGENWVHAPSVARARQLAAASGDPALELRGWECHSGSHSPYSKRWASSGGGALLRLGSHPIGAMLHWKRAEGVARDGRPIRPVSVTAEVADPTRNPALRAERSALATGWEDVESWGCALIAFEDGARGLARGSDCAVGGMESKLEVLGARFHLKCNLSPSDELRAFAAREEVFGDEYLMEKLATRAGWSTPMPDEDRSSGQLALCQDVVESLAEGRAPLADGALGLDVVRVVYAAYVSASEGRRVALELD